MDTAGRTALVTPARIKGFLVAGVLLLVLSLWRGAALPPATELDPALLGEPLQQSTSDPPFSVVSKGVSYTVKPLYRYELAGLVVSEHSADSWWDFVHREWQDRLNVVDLCVVWGENVRRESYANASFSSGQFTCYYGLRFEKALAAFDVRGFSNNHLLTGDPQLARLMRTVRVGDQIQFRGRLVEYSHKEGDGFWRGTSITRDDAGNQSCETVYVDAFEVIRRKSGLWHVLSWVAGITVLVGIAAWFAQPVRYDD